MAFIFTCGTHTFSRLLEGYENVTVQCQNCGNFSGRVYRRWEWFTFCFIPLIPFSLRPWHEVGCHICNFFQDLKYRPDAQHPNTGGIGAQQPGGGAIPMQPQNQGWGPYTMHGGGGPPPQQPMPNQSYGGGQMPSYK